MGENTYCFDINNKLNDMKHALQCYNPAKVDYSFRIGGESLKLRRVSSRLNFQCDKGR